MLTQAVHVDLTVAVAVGGFLLTVLGSVYMLRRYSLDQPKVRITASRIATGSPDCRYYIVVQLTNAGRRPVTLAKVWPKPGDSAVPLWTHPDDPVFDPATCFPRKRKLEEGDQTCVCLPHNEFVEASPSPVERFLAVDTTGKTWQSKKYPLGKRPIKPVARDSG